MENFRLRSTLALLGLLLSLFWVLPNFVPVDHISWWPSKSKLNYGLDIQGGLHLVMGADVDAVVTEGASRLVSSLQGEMSTAGIKFKNIQALPGGKGQIRFEVENASDKAAIEKHLSDKYASVLQISGGDETSIETKYYDAYLIDYKDKVIQQAIETIRNRIDEFGVSEPSISRQGENRILIQLPGLKDAERAKELINTTAKLDFLIVSNAMTADVLQKHIDEAHKAGNYKMADMKYTDYITRLNKDLAGKLPEKTVVYFEKAPGVQKMDEGAIPVLLETETSKGLGGKDLANSHVSYGQYGEPSVALNFNATGAALFAELTGANVRRQMAIVLDKVVKSAPNITERIGGGSASISLGGRDRQKMMEEAKMITMTLNAGALPASLEQLEERRVGPTLGADSIKQAAIGSFVGIGLIVLFMLVYYKAMGVIATVCLGFNLVSIFALLTTFGATLTLPGIAGIALTVGVAVDANVLINERIKDELKIGNSFKYALQQGYRRAMSAILDSNITTSATAVVLLYFGTGPVRGFAVTLLMGIATTLFANVFVSKVIVDFLVNRMNVQKISV